jgi:hypothetical protein
VLYGVKRYALCSYEVTKKCSRCLRYALGHRGVLEVSLRNALSSSEMDEICEKGPQVCLRWLTCALGG